MAASPSPRQSPAVAPTLPSSWMGATMNRMMPRCHMRVVQNLVSWFCRFEV
jgi:hypothetical protein